MPELAEVEVTRKTIEKFARGKKVRSIDVDESDRYFFSGTTAEKVSKVLQGAKIMGTGRKGKYFWLCLDRKPWPLIHLGMTGKLVVVTPKKIPSDVWEGIRFCKGQNAETRDYFSFSRLHIVLDDKTEIALTDARRFAKIWLIDDPESEPRLKRLGPDPLDHFTGLAKLKTIIRRRRIAVKAILLDQRVFAGVGNWLADEILFQARINPHTLGSQLSDAQISGLRSKTMSVIQGALKAQANYDRIPKSWLFHHRWGKNKNARTSAGKKIIHEEIGGRTTAWVPELQT